MIKSNSLGLDLGGYTGPSTGTHRTVRDMQSVRVYANLTAIVNEEMFFRRAA